jgi:hypothetical protein
MSDVATQLDALERSLQQFEATRCAAAEQAKRVHLPAAACFLATGASRGLWCERCSAPTQTRLRACGTNPLRDRPAPQAAAA